MHAAEFVEILLSKQSVLAERKSVVAGEDDHRVLPLTGCFELGEDAAYVVVEACDARVKIGVLPLRVFGCSRPGCERFIAHRHVAVVQGVQRHEGRREWNLCGIVERVELWLGRARVVWHRRCDVDVERFFLVGVRV